MREIKIAFVMLCLIVGPGCEDSGTFDVTVEFADATPESVHWAYVKIFEQQSDNSHKIIVNAPPIAFDPVSNSTGSILKIPKVPSGDNYQLSIELKEEKASTSASAYFGKSRPFSMASDTHEELLVTLASLHDAVTVKIVDNNGDSVPSSAWPVDVSPSDSNDGMLTGNNTRIIADTDTGSDSVAAAEQNVETDSATGTDADFDTNTANIYYLQSEIANIELNIKEKWLSEKLQDYRVDVAHDDRFTVNLKSFPLTALAHTGGPFTIPAWTFPAESTQQTLFVRVFDKTYGLILFASTEFVVDKGVPTPDTASHTIPQYTGKDFSSVLSVNSYSIGDSVDAYCDVPDACQDCWDCIECENLCGAAVKCDVQSTNGTGDFLIGCNVPEQIPLCRCVLTVSSSDIAGNKSTETLGEVTVDSVKPEFVKLPTVISTTTEAGDVTIGPFETVGIGSEYSFSFGVSEPLSLFTVSMGGVDITSLCASDGEGLTYTCNGEVTALDEEGKKNIAITIEDYAENRNEYRSENPILEFKFERPELFSATFSSEIIGQSRKLAMTLLFTAPMDDCQIVSNLFSPQNPCAQSPGLSEYEFEVDIASNISDGEYEITLQSGFDENSQPVVGRSIGVVTLDSVNPAVKESPAITPGGYLSNAAAYAIAFSVSETLKAIEVAVGNEILEGDLDSNCELGICLFSHFATGSEGSRDLAITMTDLADNSATETFEGLLTYDFTAPTIDAEPVVTPTLVNHGDAFTIAFTVSEPLREIAVFSSGQALNEDIGSDCAASQLCVFHHIANAAVETEGSKRISIQMIDLAGNSATRIFENLVTYEFDPPGVLGTPIVTPSLALDESVVTIDFYFSEPLTAVTVSVGIEEGISRNLEGDCDNNNQRCSFNTEVDAELDLEGDQIVTIQMTDLAGNSTTIPFSGLLRNDFTPPQLVSSTIVPENATEAEEVRITLDFDESVVIAPDSIAGGGLVGNIDVVSANADSTQWELEYTVNGSDVHGAYAISILELSDAAGHVSTGIELGQLRVWRHIFVDADANAGGDGFDWDNAYSSLSDALANDLNVPEIWVAEGTYHPELVEGDTETDPREATFRLNENQIIYGGFNDTDSALSVRNLDFNALESSDTDLGTVLDGDGIAYHVVTGAPGARLDGVVVKNGLANGSAPNNSGGGVYIDSSASPFALRNCVITDNNAAGDGGGLYASSAEVTVQNCQFSNHFYETWRGGGIYAELSPIRVIRSAFTRNYGISGGSGIHLLDADGSLISNCEFTANWSEGDGPISIENTNITIQNVVLYNNDAFCGGALTISGESQAAVVNCTFALNEAETSYCGEDIYLEDEASSVSIDNSIFWCGPETDTDCGEPIEPSEHSGVSARYTNIAGYLDTASFDYCTNCMHLDPMFSSTTDPIDLAPVTESPCIDAGSNALLPQDPFDLDTDGVTNEYLPYDITDGPRCLPETGCTVDMGAFEHRP